MDEREKDVGKMNAIDPLLKEKRVSPLSLEGVPKRLERLKYTRVSENEFVVARDDV